MKNTLNRYLDTNWQCEKHEYGNCVQCVQNQLLTPTEQATLKGRYHVNAEYNATSLPQNI